MIRAYRYKMKPNKAQTEYFSKCFGCCRFVYNHALQERKDAYANNKKSPAVTGITDADGADSENNTGTGFRKCDYASDETSMQNEV